MTHYLSTILLTCVCAFGLSAQEPETQTYNGKNYYVYPYQQDLEVQMRTFRLGVKQEEVIHRDSLNRAIVSTEIRDVRRYIKMTARGKSRKLLERIRREYPDVYYPYYLSLEQDITPTLEPLPDGEYIQYYRDLPFVDEDNILRYRNDIVSAVFSLKNNQLDGKACWLTAAGDTIKAGRFTDGLKEGPWFHYTYEYSSYDPKNPKADPVFEKYRDGSYKKRYTISAHYKNGLKHGPYRRNNGIFDTETGFYTNGDASGEWFFYGLKTKRIGYLTMTTDEPILLRHYRYPEKTLTGRSVIIRNMSLDGAMVDRLEYDIMGEYPEPFCRYYKLHEEQDEEGLELPEEKVRSYPGESYGEGMIYGDYGPASIGSLDFSYSNHLRKFYVKGKEYTRAQLIDSVGYEFRYDFYEEFHSNGQRMMHFEVKNGVLVSEDTVFWDNGTPLNVINRLPETDQYEELVYDYNGKLIYHYLYNAQGNFVKAIEERLPRYKYNINGRIYKSYDYDLFYEYQNYDTLNYNLTQRQVTSEFLWKSDSALALRSEFDPETHQTHVRSLALGGTEVLTIDAQFGDEYENVSASETYTAGNVVARTLMNGAYMRGRNIYESDTVPNKRVKYWMQSFDLQSDYVLESNGQPFTGKFTLTAHERKFDLKTSASSIHIDYANGDKHGTQFLRALKAYEKHNKLKKLAPYITMPSVYSRNVSDAVTSNLLPFIGYVFTPVEESFFAKDQDRLYYDEFYYGGKMKLVGERRAHSFDKEIEGQFLNGKPSGKWIARDQHGRITAEVSFVNGEIDGEVVYHAVAYPASRTDEYDMYGGRINPILRDSFPEKATYYVAKVCHYKNGILNGEYVEKNWMGDTVTHWNYVDGRLNGPSLERTKIAFTLSHYEDGYTDGITQTYLTLPGKDTMLLFDLNFQNGALQGESKSYHLNGKMAKHGFFYGGDPIDDFEAYDTLGFRYQYVKFQYNQPIEEKIWEENQLSVRYEFDWRDSIYFNTRDIAGSSSLERMLYELGIERSGYREPYYGRPSLVDKTGIDYTMTKYYPNDTVARHGDISSGKKVGCWMFYNYEGRKLYEVDYADTILQINDSVRFKSKGILTLVDTNEQPICRSYIVEKIEKYDCSHTDHHEIRMLYTFWERDSSEHRINGYVKNYYDNGVLMNEGQVNNGLATGVWKFYDPYGQLNMVGEYVLGKRNGRWLSGDLSQVKYMGDICLNPNLPNLEEIMSYQEKMLDISVIHYQMTKVKKREYYGVNMNNSDAPMNIVEGDYYDSPYYDYEYYDE